MDWLSQQYDSNLLQRLGKRADPREPLITARQARLVVFRSVLLGEDVDRRFGRSPVRRQVDLAGDPSSCWSAPSG